MDEDRTSDVPTGQPPSAQNQQSIQEEADELEYELSFLPEMKTKRDEKLLMRAIALLGKIAVKAVAVDTNEERTTASQALHGGETRERI